MYRVDENDGLFQPVLVLSNPSLNDISIQVTDSEVTATTPTSNVTGGDDYIPGPYSLTIPAGHTSACPNN